MSHAALPVTTPSTHTAQQIIANGDQINFPLILQAFQAPAKSASDPEVGIKHRKESHKEVERRRRENINHAISELGEVVPGNEKNKGRIIQGAADYIRELRSQNRALKEKVTAVEEMYEQA